MEPLDTRVGLQNIGNTCFLNAVLQALRLCPAIGKIFLGDTLVPREGSRKRDILPGFQTLMKDLWRQAPEPNERPVMVPHGFFQTLMRVLHDTDDDWYRRGQQADAAEALQYVIDSLHDATYRRVIMNVRGAAKNEEEKSQIKALESWAQFYSKEYSPLIDNFYGQSQVRVTCGTCGNVSERYEPWLILKVPIPGSEQAGGPAPTLDTCIRAAFEPETLEDYHCDKCKKATRAEMTTQISRLPPYLILAIKRFTNAGHKVRGKIAWNLDATDFGGVVAFQRNPFGETRLERKYATVSVIEHIGGVQSGHYHMYNRQKEKWYNYDDSSVRLVTPEQVVNEDSYTMIMVPKQHMSDMYAEFEGVIERFRQANTKTAP
jgi:ubiquitin C-terminal hydrolase